MKNKLLTRTAALGTMVAMAPQLTVHAEKDERPNILVILADDLGYSDMGCYGGEINTPNLDGLAEKGMRFTRFYNSSRSCPSRTSLLTGLYPHQAGVGHMVAGLNNNSHGYRGDMLNEAVTVAQVLKEADYNTAIVGKWHVAHTPHRGNQGQWLGMQVFYSYADYKYVREYNYPANRGFDDSYSVMYGVVNFFDPFSLVDGTQPVDLFGPAAGKQPQAGIKYTGLTKDGSYYVTDDFSNKAVEYINKYDKTGKPFFMYLSYTAPHWPLHAPEEEIKKYENTYTGGWDEIRNARYEKMKKIGVFGDRDNFLTPRESSASWNTNEDRAWDARAMAVHAAMIDRMDQGIGKVIKALKDNGQLDNTLILFMSDNGCSPEWCFDYTPGGDDRPGVLRDGTTVIYPKAKGVMPGPENTFASIGPIWANVANTPFRLWKAQMHEGGICTPMIAHWPAVMKEELKGKFTEEVGHVMDVMATCVELAGATYPEKYKGYDIIPMEGKSLAPIFKTGTRTDKHEFLGFEHEGRNALITKDDWKIVKRNAGWELYNLKTDRTEMINLATQHPDKLQELVALYEEWAVRVFVKDPPAAPEAISSYNDLQKVRDKLTGNFYLTQDIVVPDGTEWIPIGAASAIDGDPKAFQGIFDGKGYSIKNIKVTNGGNFKGFFPRMKNAQVKDLGLEVDIIGGNPTGGLSGAAYAESKIERVWVTGKVQGTQDVGGLLGRIATDPDYPGFNLITDCFVNAAVKATNDVGGLVGIGRQNGKIKNVYVAGTVEASTALKEGNAGGLVGAHRAFQTFTPNLHIENSVVLCNTIVGGTPALFYSRGVNGFSAFVNSYARNDIALVYNTPLDKGPGATMVKDDMLKAPADINENFFKNTLKWDFENVWRMVDGVKYPLLRNNYIPNPDTAINSSEKKSNDQVFAIDGGIRILSEGLINANVYDLSGQMVCAIPVSNNSFVALEKGIYIINTHNDGLTASSKVIVK